MKNRKILLIPITAVLLVVLVWQGYLTIKYRLYDGYQSALSNNNTDYEVGTPFLATADNTGMALAAENERLKLYINLETADIAVYDKLTKTTTYAVPPDAESDAVAAGVNKSLLKSSLSLEYFNADRLPAKMNSYDHAVSLGQFEIEAIENGIRCIYTLGDTSSPTGLVPLYITEERLDYFLDKIKGTREYTRNRMRYTESKTVPGYLELMESIRTAKSSLRELEEVLISTGYTQNDYFTDMAGSGMTADIPIHFVIPVEYRLENDSLKVNINTSRIEEYSGGRIEKIQLLRSFGAGSTNEEGYFVVPNGSGSLIHFNNNKQNADEYTQYIYGQDPLLSEYVTLGTNEPARLPYFGIYKLDNTILARMESGETLAMLTAGISGKYSSYNYIYPTYVLRGSMSLAMFGSTGNESTLPIVENEMPILDLTVRYSFLSNEYDGYSGMANYAREQLLDEGFLTEITDNHESIPLYFDLIGSVMGQKFIAGVSYMGQITMTDYKDAASIVEDLNSLGISRQVVNYQGWFNRGYYHDVADRINPVSGLGNVKELEKLAKTIEERGGKLYSDTIFQNVPFSSRRFQYTMESSRYYGGGMTAAFGKINPITLYNTFSGGYTESMYNVLSPRFLIRYVESYNRAFSRYDLSGTSLRDLADTLASDRKRTGMINREEAKITVMYSLDLLKAQGKSLMASGGNLYALSVCDDLMNVPLSHNAMHLVDEEIPFYEMIIHGCIPYAGSAINLDAAYDENEVVLTLVEYGAAPHFAFTSERTEEMKYTGLSDMYSTSYESWRDTAISIYNKVNSALSSVADSTIVSHEILTNDLRIVSYKNGVQILINRSDKSQEIDGFIIEPMSFSVKGDVE